MPLNAFFDGIDNVVNTGRFFVALTERIGDGILVPGEDATGLARAFGLSLPPELASASIISVEERDGAEQLTSLGAEEAPLHIGVT